MISNVFVVFFTFHNRLTVVKDFSTYWTNIEQSSFDYLNDPAAQPISTGPQIVSYLAYSWSARNLIVKNVPHILTFS